MTRYRHPTYSERVLGAVSTIQRRRRKPSVHINAIRAQIRHSDPSLDLPAPGVHVPDSPSQTSLSKSHSTHINTAVHSLLDNDYIEEVGEGHQRGYHLTSETKKKFDATKRKLRDDVRAGRRSSVFSRHETDDETDEEVSRGSSDEDERTAMAVLRKDSRSPSRPRRSASVPPARSSTPGRSPVGRPRRASTAIPAPRRQSKAPLSKRSTARPAGGASAPASRKGTTSKTSRKTTFATSEVEDETPARGRKRKRAEEAAEEKVEEREKRRLMRLNKPELIERFISVEKECGDLQGERGLPRRSEREASSSSEVEDTLVQLRRPSSQPDRDRRDTTIDELRTQFRSLEENYTKEHVELANREKRIESLLARLKGSETNVGNLQQENEKLKTVLAKKEAEAERLRGSTRASVNVESRRPTPPSSGDEGDVGLVTAVVETEVSSQMFLGRSLSKGMVEDDTTMSEDRPTPSQVRRDIPASLQQRDDYDVDLESDRDWGELFTPYTPEASTSPVSVTHSAAERMASKSDQGEASRSLSLAPSAQTRSSQSDARLDSKEGSAQVGSDSDKGMANRWRGAFRSLVENVEAIFSRSTPDEKRTPESGPEEQPSHPSSVNRAVKDLVGRIDARVTQSRQLADTLEAEKEERQRLVAKLAEWEAAVRDLVGRHGMGQPAGETALDKLRSLISHLTTEEREFTDKLKSSDETSTSLSEEVGQLKAQVETILRVTGKESIPEVVEAYVGMKENVLADEAGRAVLVSTIGPAAHQIESLTREREALTRQISSLTAARATDETALQDLRDRFATVDQERKELQARLDDVRSAKEKAEEQLRRYETELLSMSERVNGLLRDTESESMMQLVQSFKNLKESKKVADKRQTDLESTVKDLKVQLDSLNKERDSLLDQVASLTEAESYSRAEIRKLEQEASRLEQELKDSQAQVNKLRSANRVFEGDNKTLREELGSLSDSVKSLFRETGTDSVVAVKERFKDTNQQVCKAEGRIKELEASIASAKAETENTNRQKAIMAENLEILLKTEHASAAALEDSRQKLSESEEQLKESEAQMKSLRLANEALGRQINEKQTEMDMLSQSNAAWISDLRNFLRAELDKLVKEVEHISEHEGGLDGFFSRAVTLRDSLDSVTDWSTLKPALELLSTWRQAMHRGYRQTILEGKRADTLEQANITLKEELKNLSRRANELSRNTQKLEAETGNLALMKSNLERSVREAETVKDQQVTRANTLQAQVQALTSEVAQLQEEKRRRSRTSKQLCSQLHVAEELCESLVDESVNTFEVQDTNAPSVSSIQASS